MLRCEETHTQDPVLPFYWPSSSAGLCCRQDRWLQLCAQQSEDREEPARWLCPPCFLTGSAATVNLPGSLISAVGSQFSESHGSHDQGEEREALMVPARITQANKKPETDNQNQRTHEWLGRPFPLYQTDLSLLTNPIVVFASTSDTSHL